jgi:hypothetical protein
VSFKAGNYEILFYDKAKELKNEFKKLKNYPARQKPVEEALKEFEGKEILRMEVRFNNAKKFKEVMIKKRFFKYDTVFNSFTLLGIMNTTFAETICNFYLENILKSLKISKKGTFKDLVTEILKDKT